MSRFYFYLRNEYGLTSLRNGIIFLNLILISKYDITSNFNCNIKYIYYYYNIYIFKILYDYHDVMCNTICYVYDIQSCIGNSVYSYCK